MGWKNGLQKRGAFYHYKFKFEGKLYIGTTGCSDLASAQKFKTKIHSKIALEGIGIDDLKKEVATLQKCWDHWLANEAPFKKESYKKSFEALIRGHWREIMETPVTELQPEIGKLFEKLQKVFGVGSQRRAFVQMKVLLEYGRRHNLHNLEFRYPKFIQSAVKAPALNEEQIRDFLAYVDEISTNPHVPVLIRIYAYTGLRQQEAMQLRWDQYDPERKLIKFVGKGGKEVEHPVPAEICRRLDELRKAEGINPYMFPSRSGCTRHTGSFLSDVFQRARAKFGWDFPLSPHRLRDAYITMLCTKGVPIEAVSKLARHSNIQTTVKFYYQPQLEQLREHQAVLDLEPKPEVADNIVQLKAQ